MTSEDAFKYIAADLASLSNLAYSRYFLEMMASGLASRKLHTDKVIDVLKVANRDPRVLLHKDNLFKKEALKGFSKLHFFQPSFIPHMLRKYWEKGSRFENTYSNIVKKYQDERIAMSVLSHEISIGAFEKLAAKGRLTGEWIIFKPLGDKALVVCLAGHDEGDSVIRDRIDSITKNGFMYFGEPWKDFDLAERLNDNV